MPFLDIEKVINEDNLKSRFRLVYVAGHRARELNNPQETTVPLQASEEHQKVTTQALSEIIDHKIKFIDTHE